VFTNSLKQYQVVERTAFSIVELIEKGKRFFYYLTDEEEKADTR